MQYQTTVPAGKLGEIIAGQLMTHRIQVAVAILFQPKKNMNLISCKQCAFGHVCGAVPLLQNVDGKQGLEGGAAPGGTFLAVSRQQVHLLRIF